MSSVRFHREGREGRFATASWVWPAPSDHEWELSLRELRASALAVGLSVAAVTTADPFTGLQEFLSDHVAAGKLAGLDWFDRERARIAADPSYLHATARSVVSVGIPFFSGLPEKPDDEPRGRIARYAWGVDYHRVLKERMKALQESLEAQVGRAIEARLLVDTARIVDRAAAARAGLGWYGKHSCIIVPGFGSWVMLGEMLLDLNVETSVPIDHDCGRCSRCMDQCPTGAITAPYTVETSRCLSFQTIEQPGAIPLDLRPLLGDWVFGCDVCQDVCPYTAGAAIVEDDAFAPRALDNAFPRLNRVLHMSEEEFRETYRSTAVLRAKRRGLARNAAVALGNTRDPANLSSLIDALDHHDESLVRGHAAWAIGHIGGRTARTALDRREKLEPDDAVKKEISDALERL